MGLLLKASEAVLCRIVCRAVVNIRQETGVSLSLYTLLSSRHNLGACVTIPSLGAYDGVRVQRVPRAVADDVSALVVSGPTRAHVLVRNVFLSSYQTSCPCSSRHGRKFAAWKEFD